MPKPIGLGRLQTLSYTKIQSIARHCPKFGQPRFSFNQIRQILVGVFPQIEEFLVVLDGELSVAFLFIDFAEKQEAHGIIVGMVSKSG